MSRMNGRTLVSASVVGAVNRGRLIQSLYDLGPSSRSELARVIGVNRATITGIVQPLIEQGLLTEQTATPSSRSGGKPAKPLWFAPGAPCLCAVVLMHDGIRTALVTMTGELSAEQYEPFDGATVSAKRIINRMLRMIQRTLDAATNRVLGIGVAVGGMVDTEVGRIVKINLAPALSGYALVERLEARFDLPVSIDHHPEALMLGDLWFGKGRKLRSFATIYTGDVLGCAFYLHGSRYRGVSGAGGELGHTIVAIDGLRCHCGQRGCWETVATLSWLRRQARTMGLAGADRLNAAQLVSMAGEGAEPALTLLDQYARNLAVGIANVQQVLAVNNYVLHGDVARGGSPLLSAITQHVSALTLAHPGASLRIEFNTEESLTTLRGAAGLVLWSQLQVSP